MRPTLRLSPRAASWVVNGAVGLLSLIAVGLLVVYVLASDGKLDRWGHALGRDYVNVWTAGQLVARHRWMEVFDYRTFWPDERRLFDPRLPFHFWSYPPPALFLAAPLGWTGYIPGLIAWTWLGLAALAPALRSFFERPLDRWLVLLCPAVTVDIGLGQNGAFTAALLLGGLALMRTRPGWGGVLLGLLAFKPQIGLLLPIAVFAERRWRTLGTAAATATGLYALSALVFGWQSWAAFFAHTLPVQAIMLRHGSGPFLWMMPSAYISARVLKLGMGWASLVQVPFSLFGVWLAWSAYRAPGHWRAKAATLCVATFLASPQGFNYDLIPTAAAALVLARGDERLSSILIVAALVALPAAMIPLGEVKWPVAPLVLAAAGWRLRRLALRPPPADVAAARPPPGSPLQTHSPAG